MRFDPRGEEELQRAMLLPEGLYDFTVNKAIEKTSKSGNLMIELDMTVYLDSRPMYVRDWLMVGLERQLYKVLHFCRSVGLAEKYQAGELNDHDCVGRSGKLKLGVNEGDRGPQNSVKDYIVDDLAGADNLENYPSPASFDSPLPVSAKQTFDADDSIPF